MAMIMAAAMTMSLACVHAFAANTDPYAGLDYGEAGIEKLKAADEHAFTSGSRGSAESTGIIGSMTNDTSGCYGTIKDHSDCITWSLKDGVLILTGTGYTVSGNRYSGQGPFHNNPYIETVIIDSNIESAAHLFTSLPNLKTVIVMGDTTLNGIYDCYNLENIIIGANMATNIAETPVTYSTTTRAMSENTMILTDIVKTFIFKAEDTKGIYSADKNPEFVGVKQRKDKAETAWKSYNGYRSMDELVSMAKSAITDANLPDYALAMISTELGGTAGAYDPVEGITVSAWAKDYMRAALENNLVPSYLLTIDFTKPITRAQFCALAVQTYQSITGETLTDDKYDMDGGSYDVGAVFDDIYDNVLWQDIEKAYSLGVINGYGNNKFGPDDIITREQSATILTSLADQLGIKTTVAKTPFTDTPTNWATDTNF